LSDKSVFDAKGMGEGEPLYFPVGQEQVVPGWDKGVIGNEGGIHAGT